MKSIGKTESQRSFETEIRRVQLDERLDRIASFFVPFMKAGLITAAILYIFNQFAL